MLLLLPESLQFLALSTEEPRRARQVAEARRSRHPR